MKDMTYLVLVSVGLPLWTRKHSTSSCHPWLWTSVPNVFLYPDASLNEYQLEVRES